MSERCPRGECHAGGRHLRVGSDHLARLSEHSTTNGLDASPRDINGTSPYTQYSFSPFASAYINMATLKVNGNGNGRPSNIKHPSAPSLMMNSHFASVGEDAPHEAYEHGIQVIDEDKLFK